MSNGIKLVWGESEHSSALPNVVSSPNRSDAQFKIEFF